MNNLPVAKFAFETPEALLVQTARKDRLAFKRLYEITSARLNAILLRMLGRADLAEDVLQDTFVTIWERAAHYDPTLGSAVAWMTTIARHRAIDRLRIAGREVQADPDRPFETDANLASKAINIGESFAVRRALRELSDDHRHAVMLTYSYGYTHEELAERLGVPLGTAKSWVRRGLQAMKESLAS